MVLQTIKQLDDWMTANCYTDSYGIGNRLIHEGYGLSQIDRQFVWYYTERGERQHLRYFQTEQEAVYFAFRAITADRTANRHLIGFLNSKALELELTSELDRRSIPFWKDAIPYGGLHNRRSRIFVFGCAIQRVLDLQEKYLIRY